ncbi:hypothetical protein ACQPZA_19875 [Pseudonocardia xinjiangensis]|uniref:hypothetical protein n=1 Tax=Pseudonocardia xinjiangensis TaxID=75289 RepID=UPI003D8F5CCB
MSPTDRLGTYLNDHVGGANAGVEMARQLEEGVRGEPAAAGLGPIAADVEEDLTTLRGLVEALGVGSNPVKQAAGWIAEKVHRIGVDERVTHSRELTLLLQAESLALGVEGKLALWLSLLEVAPAYPQLATVDLPALADRARDQRRRLETVRLGAARAAFASAD